MPSEPHQIFQLLLRKHPWVALELARRAGVPIPADVTAIEQSMTEFDDPLAPGKPVCSDLCLQLSTTNATFGLVIEVQLGKDRNKQWTIILYRAGLRRFLCAPAWALVFSPEADVRESVTRHMFADEPELRPFVVTPDMTPLIRDLDRAIDDYPWAVLGVAMHPTDIDTLESATVTVRALLRVRPDDYGRYTQLVAASVGEEMMQQVREQLSPEEQREVSAWERRGASFTLGRREGREEGREEGRAEALHAGIYTVLDARGLTIDDETRVRLESIADTEQLRELLARAATITSVSELLA